MKAGNFIVLITLLFFFNSTSAQSTIDSFRIYNDVKITIDQPLSFPYPKTLIVLFALPNGNTTEQTMGKQLKPNDDWHFDIQHIKAQTAFLRNKLKQNIIVAYLENNYRSWPLWKQKHVEFKKQIPHIVDTIFNMVKVKKKTLCLNGHSGGGGFIFGYLDGIDKIPRAIQRISFLDSDYGYDTSYYLKLKNWLKQNNKATITVFAYDDSVALYNGKPVVSQKGGTWYRSHLMMQHFQKDFKFDRTRNDSLVFYRSTNNQVAFFFKTNPERKIFHTQQVELNGFIHSILYRTKKESEGYEYFGQRAYSKFIQ